MHPTDKKSHIYGSIVIALAIVIITFSVMKNVYFAFIMVFTGVLTIRQKLKVNQKCVLFAMLSITGFSITLVLEYLIGNIPVLIFFGVFVLFLVSITGVLFDKLRTLADAEKRNFVVIKSHPNNICVEHRARTKLNRFSPYRQCKCRIKNCKANYIFTGINTLTGLIGNSHKGVYNKEYAVPIWNNKTREIKNGDYDIIEIYENNKINDYDAVIAEITRYFYNEINRYKPINKVVVKIIGQPKISESTKRLLEKNFLRVEYASNG